MWLCLEFICMRTDEQLQALLAGTGDKVIDVTRAVAKLALLYAVVAHCGLPRLTYHPTYGLCPGILTSEHLYTPEGV